MLRSQPLKLSTAMDSAGGSKTKREALKLWNRVDSLFSQSIHETRLCDLPVVGSGMVTEFPGDFGCLIAMATPGTTIAP